MHPSRPHVQRGPGISSGTGHGRELWPHSPQIALAPSIAWLSTAIPPPTPVPRITPNTTRAPFAAPSIASESAKQLASLAKRRSEERRVGKECGTRGERARDEEGDRGT